MSVLNLNSATKTYYQSTQIKKLYRGSDLLYTEPVPVQTFTYSSGGDSNGIAYWYGTNKNTEAWTNPVTAGRFSGSVIGGGTVQGGSFATLFDRSGSPQYVYRNWGNPTPPAGIQVIFPLKFKMSKLTFKTCSNAVYFRNMALYAQNGVGTAVLIQSWSNQTQINAINTWYSLDITSTDFYDTWTFYTLDNSNGDHYFRGAEFEFYGQSYLS